MRKEMNLKKIRFVFCFFVLLLYFTEWFEITFNGYYGLRISIRAKLLDGDIQFSNVKYVLLWNDPKRIPIGNMTEMHEMFIRKNCAFKNCYITKNVSFFNQITDFDVILFHACEIVFKHPSLLPRQRSPNQSYIFVSNESADYYYVPDIRYNGVFNFTWTYKLNSDIYFGYMIIKDLNGKVIGPKLDMSWISTDDMLPINDTIKKKLKYKRHAAAWFVSNCASLNNRQKLALIVQEELKKYNMSVDIFGKCWAQDCPIQFMDRCLQILQTNYYFYFAFENSMSDDYVTEKLLHALQNYVVPVVFGGADYNRFMPDGTYLNARNMSVAELASQMADIINDENKYHSFFKWHNHYSYHRPEDSPDTDSYCKFCEFINNIEFGGSAVDDFFRWWNPHATVYLHSWLNKKHRSRQ